MGVWGKDGVVSALPHVSTVETFGSRLLLVLAAAFLVHGFAIKFDAVSIVNQTVENAVSERRIADLLVPVASGASSVIGALSGSPGSVPCRIPAARYTSPLLSITARRAK